MGLKKKLIKGFLGVGALKLIAIPVSLITTIILARHLGPEDFGKYAFIMALIPLLAIPVSGGVQQLTTREVASYRHSNQWELYKGLIKSTHFFVFGVSAFIVGGFFVISFFGSDFNQVEKLKLLTIAIFLIPLIGLASIRTGAIKGFEKPTLAEFPQLLLQPLLVFLTIITFAWLEILTTTNAIWAQLISAIVVFFIATWIFLYIQPKIQLKVKPSYENKAWLKALLPFTLLAFVSTLNIQLSIVILGFLSTDTQVAAMSIAEKGAQFVLLSLTLVNMVIAPYIVKSYKNKDYKTLQKMAKKSSQGAFLLALPVALTFIIFNEQIIEIAFGKSYLDIASLPLIIMVLGQLSNVFFGAVGYFLSMSGHEHDTLKGILIALAANTILALILIPIYGAIGAAIASSISILIWNLILHFFVRKRLNINTTAIG